MNLNKETIHYNNYKWLSDHLSTNDEVMEVSKYLQDNDVSITTELWNADKSPETGYQFRVFLDGIDLSVNGVCFGRGRLLDHVRHHKSYADVAEEEDYKKFLELRSKYENVYKYFNR